MEHDKIVVLDFGGQYAHLIANRVRRLGVYSEILDPEIKADKLKGYKGIILSGSPMSVYAEKAPHCDKKIFDLGIPILGICYGHQLMQYMLGGKVVSGTTKEYGLADLMLIQPVGIFGGLKQKSRVWMSHGDTVSEKAPGFVEAGKTADCANSALFNLDKHFYGVQFHPEVTHSEEGMKMLDNFLNICEVKRDWSIDEFIKEETDSIKKKIGKKKVFLLASGGVDSSVAFALLEKALGPDRVYGLLVDTGLMRYKEAEMVKKYLNDAGFMNLHVADKSKEFLSALKGVTDPEAKRKVIGDLFWKVKEDTAEELKLNPNDWIMGQGTIYPDTIETGGTKHADKIKTHHNRVDLVQKMIQEGKVIEPLAQLYKDEVRDLGEKLGLPHAMVWRQPFPGPGLGVRIICKSPEQVASVRDFSILSQNIEIYLKSNVGLSDAKAIVLPVKSVGVQGDERTYRHPVAIFTKNRNWDELEHASTAITNRFSEVNRVILTLGGGYSDKFFLKVCDLSADRVGLLQKVDNLVTETMSAAKETFGIWQFPVVLAPVGSSDGKESIVLRPIVSTEAMTASFARIDWDLLDKMAKSILEDKKLSHVFYDLTHKPPGTIEWE
jgi:GMP synthase (glutamine-hydrolysing)